MSHAPTNEALRRLKGMWHPDVRDPEIQKQKSGELRRAAQGEKYPSPNMALAFSTYSTCSNFLPRRPPASTLDMMQLLQRLLGLHMFACSNADLCCRRRCMQGNPSEVFRFLCSIEVAPGGFQFP